MRRDQFFFFVCLSFIIGVFVGSFFLVFLWEILCFLSLWLVMLFSFPTRRIYASLFFLGVFFLGIFSVQQSLGAIEEKNLPTGEISGIARVVDDPEMKSFSRDIVLKMRSCETSVCPFYKILWHAPINTDILWGARIDFICDITLPKNSDTAFDYRMFLAKENIAYVCEKAERASLLPPDIFSEFFSFLSVPKRFLERALEKSIPAPESGLALGLLVGGNSRLPSELSQAFTTAGLTHIIAISGYNISLIAQGFILFGLFIGLWRKQALWFAFIGIVLFVVLVGAPASAVRAGIMASTVFFGLFFGRKAQGMNMLFLAGTVMLFFQPLLLRFDIGFELSFLATFAIILTLPIIETFLRKEFFGKSWVEVILLTIAVELFVIPLITYQFHIFSPFSLVMNIVLLPLVPYVMMTSSVTALSFLVLPGLHIIPAFISYGILRFMTYSVEVLSSFPFASEQVTFSVFWLFLWYIFLALLFLGIHKYIHHFYVKETTL